jgi:hypothetical protein
MRHPKNKLSNQIVSGVEYQNETIDPTSIKISLCSKTPRRMLEIVIPAMMISAPIMNPCDQASRISPWGSVGLLTKSFTGAMFELMTEESLWGFHDESHKVGVKKRIKA